MMKTFKNIRIGTRGSVLAMWQANHVRTLLLKAYPNVEVEIIPIKTRGDIITDVSLANIEGKSFFTKEIEDALLEGKADIAVHSGKDLPTEIPKGLVTAGFLKRNDPRDALICAEAASLADLPQCAKVGTASIRRKAFIASTRPDLCLVDLRGNLDSRLRKLKEGLFDAIILAAAGLERLGLLSEVTAYLDPPVFLPSVSQGAIALEIKECDKAIAEMLSNIIDEDTTLAAIAERSLLNALGGGCQAPLGAMAKVTEQNTLNLTAALLSKDGSLRIDINESGDKYEPEEIGRKAAQKFIDHNRFDAVFCTFQSTGV